MRRDGADAAKSFALLTRLSGIVTYLKSQGLHDQFDTPQDLSPRQMMALSHVVLFEPISVSDLAAKLSVSLATASQMVSQLAQSGFVTRSEDPTDHRRTLISLTETTGSVAAQVLSRLFAPMERAIESLGDAKFYQLLNNLDELLARVRTEMPPEPTT